MTRAERAKFERLRTDLRLLVADLREFASSEGDERAAWQLALTAAEGMAARWDAAPKEQR